MCKKGIQQFEVYGKDIPKKLSYNYKIYKDCLVEDKFEIKRAWKEEDWMKVPRADE
jgi:hypothetical protein